MCSIINLLSMMVVVYTAFVLLELDFNPLDWSIESRQRASVIMIFIGIVPTILMEAYKLIKDEFR